MAFSVVVECPVCNVAVATRGLTRTGVARDIDGNFQRDPGQHVHFNTDTPIALQCSNGHRLTVEARIVVARVP